MSWLRPQELPDLARFHRGDPNTQLIAPEIRASLAVPHASGRFNCPGTAQPSADIIGT